jgi:hypothetical protein
VHDDTINKVDGSRMVVLTRIAASLHNFAAVCVVSCCERRRRALAATVAAEESAGRGEGERGASKSLGIHRYRSYEVGNGEEG